MKRRLIATIAACLCLCALLPGVYAAQKSVLIGAPLPLTGPFQQFGITMKQSMEMAAEAVNQNGGINGVPLQIEFADDKGTESGAEQAFERLNEAGPVMLTGGYASDPTLILAKLAEKAKMPFLVCTASADAITRKGWKHIFRLNPPISEYTRGLEDFWIKNAKPKSIAVVYENSLFGSDGALRMMEFCRDQAIELSAYISYSKNKKDPLYFRSLLAPLAASPPDVIYMISYLEDAVLLVRQLRELKIPSMLCGGAGGFTLPEFIARTGDAANGLLTATLWSEHADYPGAKVYFQHYSERFGQSPDYHGAEAYSALLIAADALKRAVSFSPEDVRASLAKTYMKTPFGPVKFYNYSGFERQNSLGTLVLQVINGRFETVWPPERASMPYQGKE